MRPSGHVTKGGRELGRAHFERADSGVESRPTANCTPGPIASAKATVPTPTVPPSTAGSSTLADAGPRSSGSGD